MANTETMRPALMASESVQSYLVSIKYKKEDEYAQIHDGALVVLKDLAPNDPYNVGMRNGVNVDGYKDDNVYIAEAPEATTDEVVIVDLAEVTQGVIAGNTYKFGIKLFGLVGEAGMPMRARIPMKHDKFWLSEDCFTGEPTVGEYAIPTVGDTHHTPTAEKAEEGYCVKIEDKRGFVAGNISLGTLYLCKVL